MFGTQPTEAPSSDAIDQLNQKLAAGVDASVSEPLKEDADPNNSESKDRKRDHRGSRDRKRSRSRDRGGRRRSRDRRRSRSRSPRRRHRSRSRSRDKPRRSRFDLKSKENSTEPGGGDQESAGVYGPAVPPGAQSGLGSQQAEDPVAAARAAAARISSKLTGSAPGAAQSAPETPVNTGRKRKSRWGDAGEKQFVPGMPTAIPSNLSEDQQKQYLLQLRIEEFSRKLRSGDLGIDPDPAKRSPSPEPVYDNHGKRLNTREVRTKQRLERERHEAIQEMIKHNPMYKPPSDYKQPVVKLNEKVWIPQEDHPEVNFVGLLLGPRGNTLKALERETGARIIIRGKGSVKEGKVFRQGPLPGEDEPLHAYITSTDPEIIKGAVEKINTILEQAVEVPDGQNELRKLQLRELALLNGTLRPEDLISGAKCSNCGMNTHKTWECPEMQNVTANIVCTACGGAGHISRDCKNPRPSMGIGSVLGGANDKGLDKEYSALMAELGQEDPMGNTGGGGPVGGRGGFSGRGRGGFGRGRGGSFQPGASDRPGLLQLNNEPSDYPGRRRPEPIVRINLAAQRPQAPKPPSLMSLNVNGPQGSGQRGGSGPPKDSSGGQAPGTGQMPMPPWGMIPPMPPGMMGMPPMPGMVPPPPPSTSSEGGTTETTNAAGQGTTPSNPMMNPMMMPPWGMGMPPMGMMPWGMQPPPPPTSEDGGRGVPGPVPPPPPSSGAELGEANMDMDFSSFLAPPPPPPPPE